MRAKLLPLWNHRAVFPVQLKSLDQLCGDDTRILMSYRVRAPFERSFFSSSAPLFSCTTVCVVTAASTPFPFRDVCTADVTVYEMRRRKTPAPTMPVSGLYSRAFEPLSAAESLPGDRGGLMETVCASLVAESWKSNAPIIVLSDEKVPEFVPIRIRANAQAEGAACVSSRPVVPPSMEFSLHAVDSSCPQATELAKHAPCGIGEEVAASASVVLDDAPGPRLPVHVDTTVHEAPLADTTVEPSPAKRPK